MLDAEPARDRLGGVLGRAGQQHEQVAGSRGGARSRGAPPAAPIVRRTSSAYQIAALGDISASALAGAGRRPGASRSASMSSTAACRAALHHSARGQPARDSSPRRCRNRIQLMPVSTAQHGVVHVEEGGGAERRHRRNARSRKRTQMLDAAWSATDGAGSSRSPSASSRTAGRGRTSRARAGRRSSGRWTSANASADRTQRQPDAAAEEPAPRREPRSSSSSRQPRKNSSSGSATTTSCAKGTRAGHRAERVGEGREPVEAGAHRRGRERVETPSHRPPHRIRESRKEKRRFHREHRGGEEQRTGERVPRESIYREVLMPALRRAHHGVDEHDGDEGLQIGGDERNETSELIQEGGHHGRRPRRRAQPRERVNWGRGDGRSRWCRHAIG